MCERCLLSLPQSFFHWRTCLGGPRHYAQSAYNQRYANYGDGSYTAVCRVGGGIVTVTAYANFLYVSPYHLSAIVRKEKGKREIEVRKFHFSKEILIFAQTKHRHTFLYGQSRSRSGFYF